MIFRSFHAKAVFCRYSPSYLVTANYQLYITLTEILLATDTGNIQPLTLLLQTEAIISSFIYSRKKEKSPVTEQQLSPGRTSNSHIPPADGALEGQYLCTEAFLFPLLKCKSSSFEILPSRKILLWICKTEQSVLCYFQLINIKIKRIPVLWETALCLQKASTLIKDAGGGQQEQAHQGTDLPRKPKTTLREMEHFSIEKWKDDLPDFDSQTTFVLIQSFLWLKKLQQSFKTTKKLGSTNLTLNLALQYCAVNNC